MKKLSLLVSMVFLMMVLVACGSDASSPQPSSTEKPDEDVVVPEEKIEQEETEETPVEKEKKDEGEKKEADKNNSFYADILREGMPQLSEEQLELSQESYDFIKSNSSIFPAKSQEDIEAAKNKAESIDYRLLTKNASNFYSTVVSFEGYVTQIGEENYDNGEAESWVNVYDDDGNNHIVYFLKSTGDILEEDRIKFYAVPVGGYSMSTEDGGFANVQLFFGSHIEKQ